MSLGAIFAEVLTASLNKLQINKFIIVEEARGKMISVHYITPSMGHHIFTKKLELRILFTWLLHTTQSGKFEETDSKYAITVAS
jgi:hypothetical protein